MANAKTRVGTDAIVKWKKNGAGTTEVTLKNSDWSLDDKSGIKETPNTSDGMVRINGLDDFEGSVKGFTDDDQEISGDVRRGDIGTLKLYRSNDLAKFYQGTVIIESVKITTGVNDEEKWEMSFKKQSGVLYVPGDTIPAP